MKQKLTKVGKTMTNAVDGATPVSGIVGKNPAVRNFEISEKIFQRELKEYAEAKRAEALAAQKEAQNV